MGMRMREMMLAAERKKQMEKCRYADRYKGLVKPRCNGGKGCKQCNDIYFTLKKDQRETKAKLRKLRISTPDWEKSVQYKVGDVVVTKREKMKHPIKFVALPATPKTKSYYGGNISARAKAAHEKRIADLLVAAEQVERKGSGEDFALVLSIYRDFVTACSIVKERPYVTGTERGDRRLIAQAGVSGEAGEVSNIIKKIMFRDRSGGGKINPEKREKLLLELGDLFWYFMSTLIVFDIHLDEVVMSNMRKLVERGR